MPDQPAPQPKLRWYQYGLRTLLLLVTAVAIFMSWFAVKMKQTKEEDEIIQAISKESRVDRYYDYEIDGSLEHIINANPSVPKWLRSIAGDHFLSNVVVISMEGDTDPTARKEGKLGKDVQSGSDKLLEKVKRLRQLRSLYFVGNRITDKGLAHIGELTTLESLNLPFTEITDAGIVYLEPLENLKFLSLKSSRITDESLKIIGTLKHLQKLDLGSCQITDKGLEYLQNATQLQALDLHGTNISGQGLRHLHKLRNLQEIDLDSTNVSEEGVKELQKAVPRLKINKIKMHKL